MEADSTSSLDGKAEEGKEFTPSEDKETLSDKVDSQASCSHTHPDKSAEDNGKVQESCNETQEKDTELQMESSEPANESVVQRNDETFFEGGIKGQDVIEPEEMPISSPPQDTSTEARNVDEVSSQCSEGTKAVDEGTDESESPQVVSEAVGNDQDIDPVDPSSSDMELSSSNRNITQGIVDGSETVSSNVDESVEDTCCAEVKLPSEDSMEVLEGNSMTDNGAVDQETPVNVVHTGQSESLSRKTDESSCGSESVDLVESHSTQDVDPISVETHLQTKEHFQPTELVSHSETLPDSPVTNLEKNVAYESELLPPEVSADNQDVTTCQDVTTSANEENGEPVDTIHQIDESLEEGNKSDSNIDADVGEEGNEKLSRTEEAQTAKSAEGDFTTDINKCTEDIPENLEVNEVSDQSDQSKVESDEQEESSLPINQSDTENADEETCVPEEDKQSETEESKEEQVEETEGEKEVDLEEEQEEDDDEEEDDGREELSESKSEKRRASPIRCFDESNFSVESLFEYQWPQDHGEYFFVQEQISEYLGVTSFKRKYPALERRLIALEERKFLKDKGVVTEEQVTLGLTALKADEVYDVMQKDFPDKYAAYARLIQERQREAVKNQHKEYGTPAVDSAKMKNYIKKAVRQAAEYNASLMREKREERQYYLDLQTMLIHCPKNKMKHLTKDQTKPGPYPVAVIPGQYQNYHKSYTTEELKYLPINTALYGPTATHKQSDIAPNIPPGSEISSDDEDLSVSSEPQKPSKSESSSKPTGSKSSSKSPKSSSKGSSKSTEKQSKRIPVEPPMEPERMITPGYFKDQIQSVLPHPQGESPMISLENTPAVSLAPPPPVTQVLSQLLQQKNIIPPKTSSYVPKDIPDAICGLCLKDRESNRKGEPEELVHCSQCDNSGHPSCLEMSLELVCAIKTYPWQCMECKTCTLCGDPTHEDKMMFCDECDRGYHTFCVGLTELPTGLWACASCRCEPPAAPLPPPPETPSQPPPALNGTPESTTAKQTINGDKCSNGTKRPAEPIPTEKENQEGEKTTEAPERGETATPPPSKKRNTKKKTATPKSSLTS
ncbi:PHD finger protein 10 [Holothuria leucospilota]|uniref:PHD finger protein 10 n=1 Tax=Holothuria leucospilota TaxID=206669 RepID=A0A9Q1CIJ9_HOLLE|nr:PHD finger protein 10 [Holothuria leucospilota]